MVTLDSVKAKLQSLIAKANNKTGRSDADMTSVVDALIAGYGQGGGGITPTGSINITKNGTYDVTDKAQAVVAVPAPEQRTVVRTITLASDVTGSGSTTTLLTGDDFIKKHYADDGFSAMLIAMTPVVSETNVVHFNFGCNRNIGSSNAAKYGFGYRSTNATTCGMVQMTAKINEKGYVQHLRVDSSGNLLQYLNSGYILKAGTYQIVLTCIT